MNSLKVNDYSSLSIAAKQVNRFDVKTILYRR